MTATRLIAAVLATLLTCAAARADLAPEAPGQIELLPAAWQPHWVWVSDLVLERTALVDLDQNKVLGIINGGYGSIAPLVPRRRPEIYLATTYYARRTRGDRSDFLEVYDLRSLEPVAEVALPAKRSIDALAMAHSALSDDERFVAVFNWTPATSLSIVDVEARMFTGEVPIAGCSLVYAAGERRFMSLCSDGSILRVTLDTGGREAGKERSEPFFDPENDPVTEKAVRHRDRWLFVSFEGMVHTVDVSGDTLRFEKPWSLLDDEDRRENWRIGGWQHLAVHEKSGRLYSLVHRGGPDTHKEPGEEIWVYDIAQRRRLQRIKLRTPGITIYGFPIELGRNWIWPLNRMTEWLIDTAAPANVSHIAVTQDGRPYLITATQFSGSLGVYDALSGEFKKRVQPVGWTTDFLVVPSAP